jgi:hypothetical protein
MFTFTRLSAPLRLAAGAALAVGVSSALSVVNAGPICIENCDGDCRIGTFDCNSCDNGDPNDCWISWSASEQSCYDNFNCHWSCPACYVS